MFECKVPSSRLYVIHHSMAPHAEVFLVIYKHLHYLRKIIFDQILERRQQQYHLVTDDVRQSVAVPNLPINLQIVIK
jgi:hypothetical protein